MTTREAYDTLCGYLRGKFPDYWDLEDAISHYINLVDEMSMEIMSLQRSKESLGKRLKKVTRLKEKYYKELKDVYGLGCGKE